MELNNKKILFGLIAVFVLLAELNLNAQTKYWVKFTDKSGVAL